MVQNFSPERIFSNSLDMALTPLDPNKPAYNNQTCEECTAEVVVNIQGVLSVYTHEPITDENLTTLIDNRGTLQEFATKLISDLHVVFP